MRALLPGLLAAAGLLSAPPAQDGAEGAAFEVCVVGTIHAPWQFRWAGISPAHVRAALRKLQPGVIGVESNPEWFAKGRFHEVTFEADGVAVPFGKAHGIPVYGIDWMDTESFERRETERLKNHIRMIRQVGGAESVLPTRLLGEQSPAYLAPYSKLRRFFGEKHAGFDHINQVDDDEYARQWLRGDPQAKDFGGRRNREIAKRCAEVMRKHRGKRLVVVIGAGHKAVLDVLFGKMPGVKVLRLGKDVAAPTAAEVAAAETTEDLVVILGHNIDGERSCFHQELIDVPRMRGLVARLRQVKGYRSHAHYFAARLAYLTGDLRAAEKELARIPDQEPRARLYPYPMHHWRMVYDFDQAVRIAKAEVAVARERYVAAGKLVGGLEAEIRVPPLPAGLFAPGPLVANIDTTPSQWSTNSDGLRLITKALHLAAEQVAKPAVGMAALTHRFGLTTTKPLRLELEVRARNRARGAIELYQRDPKTGAMQRLGGERFETMGRWERFGADFRVADPQRPVHLFVYLDASPGTRFGVRKVAVREVPALRVPADWIPRTLARRYPAALLRQ